MTLDRPHSVHPSRVDAPSRPTAAEHVPPLLQLRGVSKSFDGTRLALAPTDLDVAAGEFIALIGPSGCGKTTLLRLVAGLLEPTEGQLNHRLPPRTQASRDGRKQVNAAIPEPALAGERGTDERLPDLAYVFQDATLLPWLSVRDNVALPLRLAGLSNSECRPIVQRTLGLVGLGHAAELYPRELSGGMKMRTSIARALTGSPTLLLLDEPFGALDEMTRDRLNEELLRLREQSRWTALFVTHSVSEAVFLASRVVVMANAPGRIDTIISIPFPYPRTAELRSAPEFASHVLAVTRALHARHHADRREMPS